MAKSKGGRSKAVRDQQSVSKNPNNPQYYKERGRPVPSNLPSGPKPEGK